jgi:hypothetical protein
MMTEIKSRIESVYRKLRDRNTIRYLLHRNPRVEACCGWPTEEGRLAVSPEDIEAYFHQLVELVDAIPVHFVFNIDELGHQPWADRSEEICYVPSEHSDNEIAFPVPRSDKRITLVGCIGACGAFVKPVIVIPRQIIDADLALT